MTLFSKAPEGPRFFEVIHFSPRFMSCLSTNLIGYLLKLMATSADWAGFKFCFYFLCLFSLALTSHVACWWSQEQNGWENSAWNWGTTLLTIPLKMGKYCQQEMTSYRQLIAVQVFSKSSFSWGAIYSLEGKGQKLWRHSLCSNPQNPSTVFSGV